MRQSLPSDLHYFKTGQSSIYHAPYYYAAAPLRLSRNDVEQRQQQQPHQQPQQQPQQQPIASATVVNANRKLFLNTPVRMQLGKKVWPIVDHTVNRVNHIVTQAAESASLLRNIFREGVQKQLGILKSAVSLKKDKIKTVLRGAVNLQELAANKLKNFASARLNHLALIKQKLHPPNVQPHAHQLPSIHDFRLPPPIVINHKPLLSQTVSGNYVHTYDNALPNYGFSKDKNHYADMGITSYEHFQDTVLRELEEKEERKVEATLHTLFEDEFPVAPEVQIASHTKKPNSHAQVHSSHSSIGFLPESDTKYSSPIDNGWIPMNPTIPDPKIPGKHIEIGSYANHFYDHGKPVKPVFEATNDVAAIATPSSSYVSEWTAASAQKSVAVNAPPQKHHHTRTSSRQEGSPAGSSSFSSSTSTTVSPKTSHFPSLRESIHMLAGGASISGEAKRHKAKTQPPGTRKTKLKMKPLNKLTTRPWAQLENSVPKSSIAVHTPVPEIVASLATTTRKPPSSTVITINYEAIHKKPSTFPTKYETAQSKLVPITTKFASSPSSSYSSSSSSTHIPTTHSKTTVKTTTEKKSKPTKHEKKPYVTRPTGKISRGTIKFNDSKPQ